MRCRSVNKPLIYSRLPPAGGSDTLYTLESSESRRNATAVGSDRTYMVGLIW